MAFHIFCDFDGTIALYDVGNLVFTRFGDAEHWWSLVQKWREKKIDAREMWQRQAAISRMEIKELDDFAASQPIDPHFNDFVRFCTRKGLPVSVVSDGMDAYISRILDHHGLGHLNIRSNHLHIGPDGSLSVEFPYYEKGCGSCANCKGAHLKKSKKEGKTTVYIGDGHSDLCAVPEADILFAKNDLLAYCQEHHIDCIPFSSFADVLSHLKQRLAA